ncbi:hypothetical protein HK103_001600 [Boothiomyces macroporosus]|uniref:Uncharacterized protein n=1 Tax=Boothiomyces macroporosus TaxID=261099 RepID=A0AAD5UAN9_9FUNG|nr:hypothetical protein HK103_001600 [Boothiomyces macroporosus]
MQMKYSRDQGGVHKQLKRMILLNLSILLFDWFGMGLFVIETINQVDNVNLEANFLLQTTVQVMVGIHCVCLIYVLEMLKKLSLLGLKTRPLQVEESMAKTVKISP